MEQLNNYADNRLPSGCIYCGGPANIWDHVPSKCPLERPYPPNLPVVGYYESCNLDRGIDILGFVEQDITEVIQDKKFEKLNQIEKEKVIEELQDK